MCIVNYYNIHVESADIYEMIIVPLLTQHVDNQLFPIIVYITID